MISRSPAMLLALSAVVAACTGIAVPSPTPAPPPTAPPPSTAAPATATSPSGPSTVGRCGDDDHLWEQLPEHAMSYTAAWADGNAADRVEALREGITDDASYIDPTLNAPIIGPDAISAYIGEFRAARPGQYPMVRELIPSDEHNGYLRVRWMMCDPSNQSVLEAEEIAELDSDGRIRSVVRFIDRP